MSARTPSQRGLWIAVIILTIISVLSGTRGYLDKADEAETSKAQAVDADQQKEAVVDKADTLAQQVTTACRESTGKALRDLRDAGLCRQAAATKDTIEKATDPQATTPAVTGPSQAQVNAAVRLILAGIDLQGPKGDTGRRGPSPTMTQLAQAVVSYCSQSSTPCRGLQGPKGDTGDTGAAGATGGKGDTGTAGTDAPIITTAACNTDDRIVLGFSDGTSVTVTDSDCRVQLVPEPTPAPAE